MQTFNTPNLLSIILISFSLLACDTLRRGPSNASAAKPYSKSTSVSRPSSTRHASTLYKKPSKSAPSRTYSPSTPPSSKEVSLVIEAARSYTGTPYRSGGNDESGIDCSGLICTVYAQVGVKVPRISWQQSEYGREVVSISEIQPGDWLFFVPEAGKEGYVSHAGIVTHVRGSQEIMFIHASSSRGVREDNLFSTYFKGRFVKAMRPF